MCLLREFWTTYRTSEFQNRIYTPQFEQILTSLKRKFAFSHSIGRKPTSGDASPGIMKPRDASDSPNCHTLGTLVTIKLHPRLYTCSMELLAHLVDDNCHSSGKVDTNR